MREILFRAYHIPTKRFIPIYGFNKENVFEETFDGIDIGTNVLPLSECILQQYTGLTDKKGTKIFEGDILKHPNSGIFECIFKDNGFYLFYKNIIQRSTTTEHMEIIGNIHSNPELLK